ncbi:hypothetical protein HYS28_02440 [Candidatus Uhrbacteria bacterium]|nr:hypothetical protein [Candidatus Uhrbacteria bacterium]
MSRQISDKQLIQLLERRSPHHPKHIGYDAMSALLQGRVQLPQSLPEGELPPHHYRVRTTGALPALSRLNGELHNSASELFNGRYAWSPHECCMDRDMTPGDRVFFLKGFPRTTVEMAILWGDEHGYWPATHTETNDFGCAYPDLQRKNPIVGVGSFTVDGGRRRVAVLLGGNDRRDLADSHFDGIYEPLCLFLFVSKALLGHSEP